MFRPMRRCGQQLKLNECIEILKAEPRGVLSLLGDNGYPYGIPMDHWYCEQDGKLYFHGAKNGHKIDSLQSCDKVSYCVYDKGFRKEGECALNIRSVIVFGRMHPVADTRQAETICRCLCRKFTDDSDYIDHEIEHFLSNVLCLELTPEHITGKLVNES